MSSTVVGTTVGTTVDTPIADRFGCAIDKCARHYAQKSGLVRHQRKQHALIYEKQGLQLRMLRVSSTKRQKTAHDPTPIVIVEAKDIRFNAAMEGELREDDDNEDEERLVVQQALVIESLQQRIAALEGRFASLGRSLQDAGQQAAQTATQAVEAVLDARCSELFAHILDLKEQQTLIAKKSTKWCVVCFSKENTYAFMPCRHKCVCRDCAKAVYDRNKKCPICRQAITSAKPIYDLSAMDTN